MSGAIRVDLLAKVSEAAAELWDACGIGVAFIDSTFARNLPADSPVVVRLEPDVFGRLGVYTLVLTDLEGKP